MKLFLKNITLRILVILFASGIFFSSASAQFLGNEWINYNQQYYKFPITRAAIYRIDSTTLANSGIPVNMIDARNIQLFYHGVEVPLFVRGEGDGIFNAGDFIEFFGEGNDGWIDSALYEFGTSDMLNPALSLFNDTSFYYLTWNGSVNNLRYINETDTAFAGYTPSLYYMYKARQSGGNAYYEGEYFYNELYTPEYTAGEGYCTIFNNGGSYNPGWNIAALNGFHNTIYTGPVNSILKIHVATANNGNQLGPDHHHQVLIAGNPSPEMDTILDAYKFYQRSFSVNSASLQASSEPFRVNFLTDQAANTRNAFGYFELTMPQTYNLGFRAEQVMNIPDDITFSKSRLDITNFNTLSSNVWIYDLTNRRRILTANNGGTIRALVPNDGNSSPKKTYISSEAAIVNITSLKPVSTDITHYARFRDLETAEGNKEYIIITHKKLWNTASLYENYRSYKYSTALVDIDELYDQFGFGIGKHPIAIRNYLKMTNASWTTKPEHVFIIGKGFRHTVSRFSVINYTYSLIPSIGISPTDNMYVYNITGDGSMYCAIGRLAATADSTVINYYNKVLSYEANQSLTPRPEWQKNVLHFSSDPMFVSSINGYKDIIEDSLFGGNVHTFVKNGTPNFLQSTSDSIRSLFNTGTSLVTVFGHSSGQGFDLVIDDPEQMQNTGKYPWYVVNGCLSGDIFGTAPLISERFVLTPERGAIGFISSTHTGIAGWLTQITNSLYQNIGVDDYYKTMGVAHKNAMSDWTIGLPSWSGPKINALTFQVHGDPALKFNSDSLPDIHLEASNVSFIPNVVTMEMDSFEMQLIVTNLGRTITHPYSITINRNFPEPGVPDALITLSRPSLYYKDTIRIFFPVSYAHSFGNNQFHIEADLPSFIPETNGNELSNNILDVNLNIISSDIVPVYPHKYAVIPRSRTFLKASTGDPFAPAKNYKFEIDTTDLFNSPFYKDTIIYEGGGIVKWHPGALLDSLVYDSAVYFWRVGVDSANTGNYYRFKESTFQYIPGKYGWGQDHFFQFKDDSYTYIDYNRPDRRFDFSPIQKELKIITHPVAPPGDPDNYTTQFLIDGAIQDYGSCYSGTNWIWVFVIDPVTLQPWENNWNNLNPDHVFGSITCRTNRAEKYFLFHTNNAASMDSLADMLLNDVPNDYFIGAYTFSFTPPNFGGWQPGIINALTTLGADSLATLKAMNHVGPYIFFTRKGDLSSTQEVVGTGSASIQLVTDLDNDWNYGTIYSETVGPASQWKSFHWNQHSIDANPSYDEKWVRIIGVRPDGTEDILINQVPSTTTDIYNLDQMPGFDATVHPYLKLFMFTRDDTALTPAQIDHWHVMYEGLPEVALNPNIHFEYNNDSTYQGENISFSVAVENIGDYPMDSLQMRYYVIDQGNAVHNYYHIKQPLPVGDHLIDTLIFNNGNYPGFSTFYVEANPFTNLHQPEQFHFNNIGSVNMFVDGDKLNPLLDVTFDGRHILDGDIVSAKPFINIQLKDENQLRLLDDTADFELYILNPGQSNPTKINFTNPIINFIPASSSGNYAKIEIKPDFTALDGKYQLLVRARDRSGNQSGYGDSGIYDYKIRFEVINHSTITNIFNYPNPFSTSTQWVFTLTGSEIPTEFTIRIMTISGVVVREITLNELGPIHIGNNVTSFKWNGTDEFGDKLATGVYIYQVITKVNGETIDHRSTSADKYFKNNFGKLYILR